MRRLALYALLACLSVPAGIPVPTSLDEPASLPGLLDEGFSSAMAPEPEVDPPAGVVEGLGTLPSPPGHDLAPHVAAPPALGDERRWDAPARAPPLIVHARGIRASRGAGAGAPRVPAVNESVEYTS